MGDKTRIQRAIKDAAKFQSWGLARSAAARQVHHVAVLLGDDGRFWVPATMADMERLLRAGYEAAE